MTRPTVALGLATRLREATSRELMISSRWVLAMRFEQSLALQFSTDLITPAIKKLPSVVALAWLARSRVHTVSIFRAPPSISTQDTLKEARSLGDAPALKSALSVINVMVRLNRSMRALLLLALLIAATPRTCEKGRALNLQRPTPSAPPSVTTIAVRRTAKSPAISRENNLADKICGINRDFNRRMATMQLTVKDERMPHLTSLADS